jgi:hypothetical protein
LRRIHTAKRESAHDQGEQQASGGRRGEPFHTGPVAGQSRARTRSSPCPPRPGRIARRSGGGKGGACAIAERRRTRPCGHRGSVDTSRPRGLPDQPAAAARTLVARRHQATTTQRGRTGVPQGRHRRGTARHPPAGRRRAGVLRPRRGRDRPHGHRDACAAAVPAMARSAHSSSERVETRRSAPARRDRSRPSPVHRRRDRSRAVARRTMRGPSARHSRWPESASVRSLGDRRCDD